MLDEMTLPAVLKTHQSPWHEDKLVWFVGPSLRRMNIPTQAKTGKSASHRRLISFHPTRRNSSVHLEELSRHIEFVS